MKTYIIIAITFVLTVSLCIYYQHEVNRGLEFKSHCTTSIGVVDAVSVINNHESIIWISGTPDVQGTIVSYDTLALDIENISKVGINGSNGELWAVCVKY